MANRGWSVCCCFILVGLLFISALILSPLPEPEDDAGVVDAPPPGGHTGPVPVGHTNSTINCTNTTLGNGKTMAVVNCTLNCTNATLGNATGAGG